MLTEIFEELQGVRETHETAVINSETQFGHNQHSRDGFKDTDENISHIQLTGLGLCMCHKDSARIMWDKLRDNMHRKAVTTWGDSRLTNGKRPRRPKRFSS